VAGRVYLVGAGPWDPGLLTLRGQTLLRRADTVIYDYLVNPEILQHTRADALLVPTGRSSYRMTQAEICQRLVDECRLGRHVVRLKGGDPFVFGRGGEEAEALRKVGLEFEVVPGVTAAIASCAYAGIPVTHRDYGSTLGLCTGHSRDDEPDTDLNWGALASLDTIVFYMAAKRLSRVRDNLIAAGRPQKTPVALVRWATRADQQTVVTDLDGMVDAAAAQKMTAPMTIVIGEIVNLRRTISWYEKRPLFGQRIVVTRSHRQRGELSTRLSDLGAQVIPYPTIDFEPIPDGIAEVISTFQCFDWVVFTSANAVNFFLDQLLDAGADLRIFGTIKIACIGPATAEGLVKRGLVADLVPKRYVAEGLLDALGQVGLAGQKILIPRALIARNTLPDALRVAADVVVLPVYKTVPAQVDLGVHERLIDGAFDIITFTSSSTVTNFVSKFNSTNLEHIRSTCVVVCIGPVTAQTAAENGFRVVAVAHEYTIDGLVQSLEEYVSSVDKADYSDH